MNKIVIIGGGAAGMMAAVSASDGKSDILILEQNEKLGKKIYITGKGRCNVTNACEPEKFFSRVVTNSKFLYSAFYQFDNVQLMNLLEEAGCKLKIERGERVFPVSDHASDVTAALIRLLEQKGVKIQLHAKVKELLVDHMARRICGVRLTDGTEIKADAVVLAAGGMSYPSTGSTGDGYLMAEAVGHTKKPCVPALVSFTVAESWCALLQGLTLKNVMLTMTESGKVRYRELGEMLFTHFGISGPLVLQASSYYHKCKSPEAVKLILDLKPALSAGQLDNRILRDFENNRNKRFKNALNGLLPARMIPVMMEQSGILPEKKVTEMTREERKKLISSFKELTLHVTGTGGFKEAVVTQGGISVKEVDPSTMESKLVSGLYFAGEILDVDALTGGYNLQIAWSTGHLAGASAAERGRKS